MINTIVYGWKGSIPGREQLSARHFEEFTAYLSSLQKDGQIESFDTVILDPNGAGINGFCIIRGEDAKLGQVLDSPAWAEHIVRSTMHLRDPVLAYGVCGAQAKEKVAMWAGYIPT